MRRSLDDALHALHQQLRVWAGGQARPDVRVLVYAPEDEAGMLVRLPAFARECAAEGLPIEVVDVGQRFREELESRPRRLEALLRDDVAGKPTLPQNLETLAAAMLADVIMAEPKPPSVCRALANTGALAAFTSYSAVANRLYDAVAAPVVLLFPGQGDDRALNILGLRSDPTYRVPRI